jgi:hypothetical protein
MSQSAPDSRRCRRRLARPAVLVGELLGVERVVRRVEGEQARHGGAEVIDPLDDERQGDGGPSPIRREGSEHGARRAFGGAASVRA